MADRRTTSKHSRAPLPVGTIRVHGENRQIKLRMDGVKWRRWMDYARWWWIQNKGPVPAGKRVIHLDGDQLNDDPSNLALGDPADVAFLWHDRDEGGSQRNFQKMHAACADLNRIRGEAHRLNHLLPTRWYPVDLARSVIVNRPRRQRWQVLRDCGVEVSQDNWRNSLAAALGWAHLSRSQAAMLHVLAQSKELPGTQLRAQTSALRQLYGSFLPQLTRGAMFCELCNLPSGWVMRRRTAGRRSVYSITAAAIAARGPVCPFVPMRGETLECDQYVHFTKETPCQL